EPTFTDKAGDFYIHSGDRQENLNRLQHTEKGQWMKHTILDLKVGEEVKHVRDYSKAIWDEPSGELIGLVCLMVNISPGGRYHRFFKDLPVGIFSFRKEAGLINANPRFWEMHGYASFQEVRHLPLASFIRNASSLSEMERRLEAEGSIVNQYQEHTRKDGALFTAAVSARVVQGNDGNIIGIEGILEDVSTEAIYFELANDVPVGLYKIRANEQGEHILVHCNQQYAQNRGAGSPEGLLGKDMRQFHKSAEDFNRFEQELLRADEEGRYLVDYILEAYNGKGELRQYEVHAKPQKGLDGRIISIIGAERDVSDYWETKQQLEELTTDIGKVLHAYTSTLIHSKHTMDAVMRSFASPNLQDDKGQLREEHVLEQIHHQIGLLCQSLNAALENSEAVKQLGEADEGQLRRLIGMLQGQQRNIAVQQLALVREATLKVRDLVRVMEKGNVPRELSKQWKRQLAEILRLCSLATLSRGVDAILEMETVVNNLRSYVLTRVRHREPLRRLDLYDIVLGVARNMEEFATNRGVEIRLNLKDIRNIYIDGYEDDLSRALLNIVHNAIKYSWSRRGDARVFVQVEGKMDAEQVYLSVENWGVPITQEELDQGLIFKVGYRGINSSDRRRPGTGLGLYDARKVAEKHHGKLTVASQPSLGNPPDDYTKPFVTTVTMQLPRKHQAI
ncbi:MAG: PAS domain-containing protein, partial [Phaeodactylibacter sp.]|nr:PAS domain-containing protein [Phaeodactylibacter sp.]